MLIIFMSNDNTNEWDKLWKDYSISLENWRKIFDEVLKSQFTDATKI